MGAGVHMSAVPMWSREGYRVVTAGVTGSCEPQDVGRVLGTKPRCSGRVKHLIAFNWKMSPLAM